MPGPYDYTLKGVTPIDPNAFTAGLNAGDNIIQGQQQAVQFQQAQEARAAALAQQQAQAQASAAMQAELVEASKAPSTERIAALTVKYPQLSEHFKRGFEMLAPAEKEARFRQLNNADLMLTNGKPEEAAAFLEREAAAYEEKRPQEAQSMRQYAKLIRDNGGAAHVTIGTMLASIDPKYAESRKQILTEGSDVLSAEAKAAKDVADAAIAGEKAKVAAQQAVADLNYTEQQTARLYDQTRLEAERLGFDRWKFTQEQALAEKQLGASLSGLTADQKKEANKVITAGVAASMSADAAEELAGEFEKFAETPTFSGVSGKAVEAINEATGFTNKLSAARKRFNSVVNKEVLRDLPPGAASDRDVSLMREGFPASTDDPARIAEFLRAQARVTRAIQRSKENEAAFVVNNKGSLGPAATDLVIDGVPVLAGTDFGGALKAIAKRDKEREEAEAKKKEGGDVTAEAAGFGGRPL